MQRDEKPPRSTVRNIFHCLVSTSPPLHLYANFTLCALSLYHHIPSENGPDESFVQRGAPSTGHERLKLALWCLARRLLDDTFQSRPTWGSPGRRRSLPDVSRCNGGRRRTSSRQLPGHFQRSFPTFCQPPGQLWFYLAILGCFCGPAPQPTSQSGT